MSNTKSKQNQAPDQLRQPILDARLRRNWRLMVGVTIASTVGMAVAVAPVLGEQFGTVWPWPNTHLALLGGLAVSVILLVAHLTIQQRRMSDIHGEIRCLAHLQEIGALLDGHVLGHVAPSLTHEPDRRVCDRLTPAGAHEILIACRWIWGTHSADSFIA